MKQIFKSGEPKSLVNHRALSNSSFDNLPKDELRERLLIDQGYICCYCMRRIPEKKLPGSKIEHYKCQDIYNGTNGYPDLTLSYKNLFVACTGFQGSKLEFQTCDTFKGNKELQKIDLLSPIEKSIIYKTDGTITSNDVEIANDLTDVLNLNTEKLVKGRAEIIGTIQRRRQELVSAKKYNISSLQKELKHWTSKKDGMYKEYFMVAVFFLNKFIHKLEVQQIKKN